MRRFVLPLMATLIVNAMAAIFGCSGPETASLGENSPASPQANSSLAPDSTVEALAPATIRVDGSSTVAPISGLAAEEFRKQHPAVQIPIITSGTGGGFKKFVKGECDISNASRPILAAEADEARRNGVAFLELPICFDAITVVVNRENHWTASLTVDELKRIWSKSSEGQMTLWSEIRPAWPAEKIELFGPGTASGTFDYFTEAICGKAGECRADYIAHEDDNRLVRGVAGNPFALGYFGYAYFAAYKNKLTAVKIQNGNFAEAVEPTLETIRNGAYSPLSRPLFVYVNNQSAARPEVDRFVHFYLDNAATFANRKKYPPLPADAYTTVRQRFIDRQCGSGFAGVLEVGLSLDLLLRREPK